MRKISDPELQAKILRETVEATKNKRALEENIKIADARRELLLESEAQNDIEAYKKLSSTSCRSNTRPARQTLPPAGSTL